MARKPMPPAVPVPDEDVLTMLHHMVRAYVTFMGERGHHAPTSSGLCLTSLFLRDRQTLTSISADTGLPIYTVSKVLGKLEGAGVVARERSEANRREVCVSLTKTGYQLRTVILRTGKRIATASRRRAFATSR